MDGVAARDVAVRLQERRYHSLCIVKVALDVLLQDAFLVCEQW